MAHDDLTAAATTNDAVITLATRGGTHTFAARDRLRVQDASTREWRAASEIRPGDLIAFLGRVLSVRVMTDEPVTNRGELVETEGAPRAVAA